MKRLLPAAGLFAMLALPAGAQCVMCYRTAQAQQAARARAMNVGIAVLGLPPFAILGGFVAYIFARKD